MKVLGQLEGAQLENTTLGTLVGPASTGRVIMDITTPSAAVPKVYNGTAWLQLLLAQTTALISQNSGKAVTVNWANGLYQQVVLTGHTTITFSNPQVGQNHILVITQAETMGVVPGYMYAFNIPDLETRQQPYKNFGDIKSSESQIYSFFYSPGIKVAYSTVQGEFPRLQTSPGSAFTAIDYHPKLNVIGVGRTASPYQYFVPYYTSWKEVNFGFPNFATPPTAAAASTGIAYSPEGHSVFFSSGTSPYIQGWLLDPNGIPNSNGVYANPGTLPAGAAKCVSVHPAGTHVGVGHTTTPFMSIYPIVGAGSTASGFFGTKITDPVTLPAAQVNAFAWAPTGDYLAAGSQTTPFLQVWAFDNTSPTPFGAASANPGTLPAGGPPGGGKGIAWHPSGAYIAMCMSASPYVQVFPFTRSTGVIGNPIAPLASGTRPLATCNCVQFSPCGNFLLVGNGTDLYVYDFTQWGSSSALLFDGSSPGVQINDIAIHPSGEWFTLAMNSSPYFSTYAMPRKVKNYLKLAW